MPRKSNITMTSRADGVKSRSAEMARRNPALARRLAGNPFGGGTRAIPLKEPERWHTYIANTYLDEGEFLRMKERGWEPLTAEDLNCVVEESGFRVSPSGHLVRGPQGQEMVFKMDREDHKLLTAAKTEANMKGIGSAKKVRANIAEAASSELGDEAAEYINNLDGQVIDRITGGEAQ